MVLWSLARTTWNVGLPAVVAHKRHRGSNSTPLDTVVTDGDLSGPVTEIAGRIGVAVHYLPAPRAHPHPLVQPQVGQVAAAAMVGLR
jgi:hypothetical protein